MEKPEHKLGKAGLPKIMLPSEDGGVIGDVKG